MLHDKLSCFLSWGLASETRPKLPSCRGEKRWRLLRSRVQQREEPKMTSQRVHSVSTMLRRQTRERQGHRRFALHWGNLSVSLAIAGTELARRTRKLTAKYMNRAQYSRIQLCRHQAPRTRHIPIDQSASNTCPRQPRPWQSLLLLSEITKLSAAKNAQR